jgi:hypothetical protein
MNDSDGIIDCGLVAAMENKVLDITDETNPHPFLQVSKALIVLKKYDLSPSDKLRYFIENQKARGYNKVSFTKYQQLNYGDTIYEYDECMGRVG